MPRRVLIKGERVGDPAPQPLSCFWGPAASLSHTFLLSFPPLVAGGFAVGVPPVSDLGCGEGEERQDGGQSPQPLSRADLCHQGTATSVGDRQPKGGSTKVGDSWGTRLNPQPGFSTISNSSEAVVLFPLGRNLQVWPFLTGTQELILVGRRLLLTALLGMSKQPRERRSQCQEDWK